MGNEIERTSQQWNAAGGYSSAKILKQTIDVDALIRLALYGSEEISDSFAYSQDMKTEIRLMAIKRLIDVLKELIENAWFACNKENQKELDKLEKSLNYIVNILGAISYEQYDQRTNVTKTIIDESHFGVCLNELRKIKKELPLYLEGLIFPQGDDIDLEKLKNEIIHGG